MSFKNTVIDATTTLAKTLLGGLTWESNADPMLAEAFFWDEVERLAKGKSKDAWEKLESNGLVDTEQDFLKGTTVLYEGGSFIAGVKATDPVRRFNADAMAALMVKAFKCPKHTAVEMIEKAKKPTSPNKSFSIVEK